MPRSINSQIDFIQCSICPKSPVVISYFCCKNDQYRLYYNQRWKEVASVPEISLFYGIRVTMFYSDHNPPHFHAEYAGNKALVDIQSACVIRGALPSRQLKLILAWCELHRDELMQNWELAKDAKPLNRINPLV